MPSESAPLDTGPESPGDVSIDKPDPAGDPEGSFDVGGEGETGFRESVGGEGETGFEESEEGMGQVRYLEKEFDHAGNDAQSAKGEWSRGETGGGSLNPAIVGYLQELGPGEVARRMNNLAPESVERFKDMISEGNLPGVILYMENAGRPDSGEDNSTSFLDDLNDPFWAKQHKEQQRQMSLASRLMNKYPKDRRGSPHPDMSEYLTGRDTKDAGRLGGDKRELHRYMSEAMARDVKSMGGRNMEKEIRPARKSGAGPYEVGDTTENPSDHEHVGLEFVDERDETQTDKRENVTGFAEILEGMRGQRPVENDPKEVKIQEILASIPEKYAHLKNLLVSLPSSTRKILVGDADIIKASEKALVDDYSMYEQWEKWVNPVYREGEKEDW